MVYPSSRKSLLVHMKIINQFQYIYVSNILGQYITGIIFLPRKDEFTVGFEQSWKGSKSKVRNTFFPRDSLVYLGVKCSPYMLKYFGIMLIVESKINLCYMRVILARTSKEFWKLLGISKLKAT